MDKLTDGLLKKYSVTNKRWPGGSEHEGSLQITAPHLLLQMNTSL